MQKKLLQSINVLSHLLNLFLYQNQFQAVNESISTKIPTFNPHTNSPHNLYYSCIYWSLSAFRSLNIIGTSLKILLETEFSPQRVTSTPTNHGPKHGPEEPMELFSQACFCMFFQEIHLGDGPCNCLRETKEMEFH